jgi:hypothetical protein
MERPLTSAFARSGLTWTTLSPRAAERGRLRSLTAGQRWRPSQPADVAVSFIPLSILGAEAVPCPVGPALRSR